MKKLLFLLILCLPAILQAQSYSLMADREGLAQVRKVTDLIYNSQHSQANQELDRLARQVPLHHPVHPMLKGLNLYWQDAPMHTGSPSFEEFKAYLQQTVEFSEAYLKKEQDETLVTFLALSAHSLLTRFHADKGDYMATVGSAKNAYSFMKKGFDLTDEYSEFLFPVGLYNYYREKYPEMHPVYKPFMFFFRNGDKEKGLEQLRLAAKKNVFTKPEAALFLVHIYLHYENNPAPALRNIRRLYQEYPQNTFLRIQYTDVLLANAHYNDAKPHIEFLLQQKNPYHKMSGELFQAIYLEKKERDIGAAAGMYQQSLNSAEPLSYMANTYRAMAYAGTARIYHQQNEPEKARAAYKKAMELTSYEYPVKQEARIYLQQ